MTTATESDCETDAARGTPGNVNRRAVLLLVAMLVVVLVVPALPGRARTLEPFDQSLVERLGSDAPEIVFLGNSLLETRIDADYLAELADLRAVSLAIDGTGPGIWYLQLKNVIGASANRPEEVVIFFHDDLITRPISFTGPGDRGLAERLSQESERDYESVVIGAESAGDRIRRVFAAIYPLADSSSSDRNSVSSAGAFVAGMNRDEASAEADRVFEFASKREQEQDIQQPRFHGTFESRVEASFLPLLVEQAGDLSIELVLVRVSAKPEDDGSPNEPDSLAEYTSDLSTYLTANGVRYIDMTGNPGIDAGMYYDGYHLIFRYRSYYTEIFSEWLLSDRGPNP
ncbi:MAG: hypothetical protein O6922_02770 [Chloroflexi bacterium]|nr:hypothetical protein [Chloroflexota bacterium]